MITFLTSPKPFAGIAKTNQINAIRSWLRVAQDVEVILYGKSKGTGEAAQELGIECVLDIQTNEFGTPLFGAIAAHAAIHGKHDIQCYVNCDILLSNSLLNAIHSIRYEKYLTVGQRIDLAEGVSLDVTKPDYLTKLKTLASEGKALLHPPAGSDYFLFRRGMWAGLPEIVIGRGGYDNALINHCLRRSIPVIDTSFDINIFHQYHNYNHTQGGKAAVFEGIEASNNLSSLATAYRPTLLNADWIIKKGQLRKNYCRGDWLQYFWSSRYIKGKRNYIAMIVHLLWQLIWKVGLINVSQPSWEKLLEDTAPDH
jgi:hypothetical protein